MLTAVAAGPGHPAVAALLGLGAAGLAAVIVAMAWNVHVRQIRLAELLARRQFLVLGQPGPADGRGGGPEAAVPEAGRANGGGPAALVIDGPDTVVAGEQARYRVRPSGNWKVVSWAVGGGSVSQSPDPAHPDELLLIADRPGNLTVMVRVREGMTDRRGTKPVAVVPEVPAPAPPVTLRLFLHAWGLVAVAVLISGLAGALVALGSLPSPDFIALVTPLAAVLGVVAVARGTPDGASQAAGKPAVPAVPTVPAVPAVPAVPPVPAVPAVPTARPAEPPVPGTPAATKAPAAPRRGARRP
jgi:hypothetical protein